MRLADVIIVRTTNSNSNMYSVMFMVNEIVFRLFFFIIVVFSVDILTFQCISLYVVDYMCFLVNFITESIDIVIKKFPFYKESMINDC